MFRTNSVSILCILVVICFFPFNAGAEEKIKVYTLKESIDEAISNNWSILIHKEKIDEARFKKRQAWAEFLPKFSTSYGYTRLSEPPVMRADFPLLGGNEIVLGTEDNYQWKGTITQPIFRGFAIISSYELAKLTVRKRELELELEKLDLALDVKEAYFNILKSRRAVEVAEKAVEALESHLEIAKNFYKVGMIPVNDLLRAEVELENARHELVKARNYQRIAEINFNNLLRRDINTPVYIKDILSYEPEKGDFEYYYRKALENRPELKIVNINILQTDQQIRLAKSRFYPEASFMYEYIKEGEDLDVSGSDYHDAGRWEAMAVLKWTFWEWGKTRNSLREKWSMKRQLIQLQSQLKDRIRLQIKEALLDLKVAEKNIPTTKSTVCQAQENLRVSRERYKAKVATSTEVFDAQSLLTKARTNYYNALYEYNLAKARLYRATGQY
jgi:outer membrane protein TolC